MSSAQSAHPAMLIELLEKYAPSNESNPAGNSRTNSEAVSTSKLSRKRGAIESTGNANKRVASMANVIEELKALGDKLKALGEAATDQLAAATAQHAEQQNEVVRLKAKVAELEAKGAKEADNPETVNAQLAAAKANLDLLTESLRNQSKIKTKLHKKIETLEEAGLAAQALLQAKDAQLQAKDALLQAANALLQDKDVEKAQLHARIAQLTKQVAKIDGGLHALLSTTHNPSTPAPTSTPAPAAGALPSPARTPAAETTAQASFDAGGDSPPPPPSLSPPSSPHSVGLSVAGLAITSSPLVEGNQNAAGSTAIAELAAAATPHNPSSSPTGHVGKCEECGKPFFSRGGFNYHCTSATACSKGTKPPSKAGRPRKN
ncbi:hypothetical protein TeGR_g10984 [Tetraparma gracilis]|uniref:C2H2-type domain-containing protein n=1 Tax=Tetraparma gracilis TaxID=2962635 RepID=A0ABQ6ME58_9STRA|nr:hypothetical protein TeGR_g10984 [Tetraparma gracilis]